MTQNGLIQTKDSTVDILSKDVLKHVEEYSNGGFSYHENLTLDESRTLVPFLDLISNDNEDEDSVKPFIKTTKYAIMNKGLLIEKELMGIKKVELVQYYIFSNGVVLEVENNEPTRVAYVDSEDSFDKFLKTLNDRYTFFVRE